MKGDLNVKEIFKRIQGFCPQRKRYGPCHRVIIGAAFQDIVTSLTESFINPLINCIGGAEVAGKIKLGNTGQALDYGAFLTAVINFIIMAFVLFLLMKGINTLMHIGRKKEEEEKKEVAPPEPSKEEVLLTEIRDLLKAQCVNDDSEKTE